MNFKDHFSERAALYSQFRPHYPDELFQFVARLAPHRDAVWDCATGSGQAAEGLSRYFAKVLATDASEKQIAMATPHAGVEYRVATAEASGLAQHSVDIVTVAQALHWFDHDRFYDEVRRVVSPGGAIAVWGYGDPIIDDAAVHQIVHGFNRGIIESYWKPERDLILAGLKTISFPFREVEVPEMMLECRWTLGELAGYMRTWSATAAYAGAHNIDPVEKVEADLRLVWGGEEKRRLIQWPLYIRAGYLA